jgi:IS30 family transposase
MAQHLTLAEREVLYRLKRGNIGQQEIAKLMGRHPSTVCRELKRNQGLNGYHPEQAQRLAKARRQACRRPAKLEDSQMHHDVEQKLRQLWSPDQIAGRLRAEFPQRPQRWLSRQTIYNWIHRPT